MFELELSWVGEFTEGVHKRVPAEVSLFLFFLLFLFLFLFLFLTSFIL